MSQVKDINFAIPETKRPPIYTSMKYWGKKPHNIWYEYINTYVPDGGIYLDPFAGSGMSGIEAVRAGKKAICLDINPLTSFIFDIYCSEYNDRVFKNEAMSIFSYISASEFYKKYFLYEQGYVLHNIKYRNDLPYEVCFVSIDGKDRFERIPTQIDLELNECSQSYIIETKYPHKNFRKSSAFSVSFLKAIGNNYACLFTKKNLALLSLIFERILVVENTCLKKQLLFAFIQTVHLCCKMCMPRSKQTKRDYSTSWGRSAFFYAKSSMEMNPLLVFFNNCIGKQSVSSCLSFLHKYVKNLKGKNITSISSIDLSENYNLWYGIKDSKHLSEFISRNSVDFVLTDPPYGGLVPYLDLSYIWLAWLELVDPIYNPDYSEEISVNDVKNYTDFQKDMAQVLLEIQKVTKSKSKIVLTFNNKETRVWKSFLGAILDSNYTVEKVIHQQNLRSGESNVKDKYGTSSSDFYIRCVNNSDQIQYSQGMEAVDYICMLAEKIILCRNEPTPYQILFNGILANLSSYPRAFLNYDNDLISALKNSNRFYIYQNKDTSSGNYWWIQDREYDPDSIYTLTNRVRFILSKLFTEKQHYKENELLGVIYRTFPNGLTPDNILLKKIIAEYANKKGDVWIKK